jgi:hypothetical protein
MSNFKVVSSSLAYCQPFNIQIALLLSRVLASGQYQTTNSMAAAPSSTLSSDEADASSVAEAL